MPTGSLALPAPDRARIIGALELLASDQDGEVVAAARAFTRIIKRHGLRPGDVVAGGAVDRARPQPAPRDEWRHDLALALRHLDRLDEWPAVFSVSLSKRRTPPTPAQRAKLNEIAVHLRGRGYV